jgi:hypothetical protein
MSTGRELVPQHIVDRANEDIVGVIRGYLPDLKKAGKNWVALCPFHKEKTPSFGVVESKEFYYCQGCGANGDAVKFVREMNPGMSFRDAVQSILGELILETSSAPRKKIIRATRCDLPGHAEDREKAASILSTCNSTEQHKYLMQNNTASNVSCLNLKASLVVPLVNNIGETVNVAAINPVGKQLAPITYAAGNPSFGSAAILEPEGEHDGKTIICIDYAHAWRIWWSQMGRSKVLCAMEYDNFNWMVAHCRDRFTHIGCDPSDADQFVDDGYAIVALPLDPYTKVDRRKCCA